MRRGRIQTGMVAPTTSRTRGRRRRTVSDVAVDERNVSQALVRRGRGRTKKPNVSFNDLGDSMYDEAPPRGAAGA